VHNLSDLFTYTVQYSTTGGASWTNIGSRVISSSEPIVDYFNDNDAGLFRILVEKTISGSPGVVPAPVIAHIKMGQALVLERRIFTGYEPTAIKAKTIGNGSENGQFLGQVVTRKYREPGAIKQTNNSVDFVRDNITPFLDHCIGIPYYEGTAASTFIFAWRPTKHPSDVIYAWQTDIEYPSNQSGSSNGGLMSWSVSVGATL
jgi:hypothetical protein